MSLSPNQKKVDLVQQMADLASHQMGALAQDVHGMNLQDTDIQSQLDAGFGSPLTRQRQAQARQTEAKIAQNPSACNADQERASSQLNEQMKETQQQQQLLQKGFDDMAGAITNAFESAIVSGGNFKRVLLGLTEEQTKIIRNCSPPIA